MATLATVALAPVGLTTTGTTAGQAAGWTAVAASGGDKIPITGKGTILRIKTGDTACTVTINSVPPSNYGTDVNMTVVLSTTEEFEIYLANDGRWDLGGADRGLAGLSYSAVTNVMIAVKVVPG